MSVGWQYAGVIGLWLVVIVLCDLLYRLNQMGRRVRCLDEQHHDQWKRCCICGQNMGVHDIKRHAEVEYQIEAWKVKHQ